MSVFLVGGVVEPGHGGGLLAPFVAEAGARASGRPRLAVLLLDREGSLGRFLPDYEAAFGGTADVLPVALRPGEPLDDGAVAVVRAADGVVVGGGLTPGYHQALAVGLGDAVREAVAGGAPYAGFSAGAMVAGERALLGGYLADGHAVCEEGCSEGLDDLTVRPGLGLVPFTCDVHVTAAGTLGRALEVVAAGLVAASAGLDEDTCLRVPAGGRAEDGEVSGAGSVWLVRPDADGGVRVTRRAGR
jgi:cyanophycinase